MSEEYDESWEDSEKPDEEPAVTEDDWAVQAEDWDDVETVTVELEITKHAGKFNPDIAKYLFYGESGTGKTRLASTFPDVIFADIDHGMASVTAQVDRIDIADDPKQDISAFEKLKLMYQFLKAGNHQFKTVVLDTLNEMQRIAMRATVEDFPAIRRSYENLPSMSDYGKMLHDMVELTLDFVALPMQVVLLAQVISRQFDTDILQPQLIGKNTSRDICRKMDVIGYIQTSANEDPATHMKYPEVFFNSAEAVVKDRTFKLPAVMVNPSYTQIRKALDN